ncbi:MAG: RseA family anti-sigma factor [Pseudomonadota bacterium]
MKIPAQHAQTEDDNLSALFDGELDDPGARAILKDLSRDPERCRRLAEYALIGDSLRGLNRDAPHLTTRVMAALEQEPTVLAPMARPRDRRPALWLAAATVAAITWGLWSVSPRQDAPAAPMAAAPGQAGNVLPYLEAHQDFAQAVVAPSEMQFTRVNLAGVGQ